MKKHVALVVMMMAMSMPVMAMEEMKSETKMDSKSMSDNKMMMKSDDKMMMKSDNKTMMKSDKMMSNKPMMSKDIVQTAMSTGMHKTFVKALESAGLVATLEGKGPYTVFAPTDAAFAKLPKGTLASLMKPENKEKLKQILTYHVVSGNVMSAEVAKMTSGKSIEGSSFKVTKKRGNIMIDGAKVVKANVKTSNGTIHVIDKVLMPSM